MGNTWWVAVAVVLATVSPVEARAEGADRILFESDRAGNADIWVMGADGSAPVRLTDHPAADQGGVWSPDGTRVAFHSWRTGDAEIYTMAADGSDLRRLTFDPGFDGYASWSVNDEIVFSSTRDETLYGTTELYKMNADGSSPTRLTANEWSEGYAAWAPDGSAVLYAANPTIDGTAHILSKGNDIFRLPADGGVPEQLTDNLCEDRAPAPSPDGRFIAYSSDCGRGQLGVTIMRWDGTAPRTLTTSLAAQDWPTWSPDGRRIVFGSYDIEGLPIGAAPDLVIADVATGRAQPLTRTPLDFDGLPWFAPR